MDTEVMKSGGNTVGEATPIENCGAANGSGAGKLDMRKQNAEKSDIEKTPSFDEAAKDAAGRGDPTKPRTVYVVGHKNPDTDSICSAISYAYLKNQTDGERFRFVPGAG